MIFAVDPGDTTGWACWNMEGDLLGMGMCKGADITDVWLEQEGKHGKVQVAIVEDFTLFAKRSRQQSGSKMRAPRGIGAIQALAKVSGAKYVEQDASIKPMALRWSQISMPKQHSKTHEWDAYLHGYYYLVNEGIIKTQLQLEKEAEQNRGL